MTDFNSQTEQLFQDCLERPPEAWESFLESSCPDDPDLRQTVLNLLAAHQQAEGFMESDELVERDSVTIAAELQRIAPAEENQGDQIGRYRLIERIGEGSWGSVWRAEQTEDIKRQVALKIIKLGLDTKEFMARFESERQMLAMMDHSNIAKVLDAGATSYGRPYFVMELIQGKPLLEYANEKCLSIKRRLGLFAQICRGIHHAHQKGFIHRDLKPSNILVAEQDGEPVPKIIDFGIAKTTQFHVTDKTVLTQFHTFLGTPVYCSPEQLDFSGIEVDRRADVYSLGVLLYELLCGRTPFDPEILSSQSLEAMRIVIREEDPPKPSTCFSRLSPEQAEVLNAQFGSSSPKLSSLLKGDLDRIVMKCLEKDRDRRYSSADALASDITAYQEQKPVSATTPSMGYRIKKIVTRKKEKTMAWALVPALVFALLAVLLYLQSGSDNSTNEVLVGQTDPNQEVWVTRQIIEIKRLQDLGEFGQAFELARQIEPLLPEDLGTDEFWSGFSWSSDIKTDPPGANLFRQSIDDDETIWEDLGKTPLANLRFALREGYRLRYELEAHRTVERLQSSNQGGRSRRGIPVVKLDPVDELPEEMVRIPSFTHGGEVFADFFMDRFEISNRDYERFVSAGGYKSPDYWNTVFEKDGEEISWKEAMGYFVDQGGQSGPSTWIGGTFPSGKGDYPVGGISWYEALAYAAFVGKELPTVVHHQQAMQGFGGHAWLIVSRSNLVGDGPRLIGENRAMTTLGIYDLIGNVREWCWNEEMGQNMRETAGAAWPDAEYHVNTELPKSPWNRHATHGFRLIRTFEGEEKLLPLRQPVKRRLQRNLYSETPASDAEFAIYKRLFTYDPFPLNAEVVELREFDHWTRERVDFDFPNGRRSGVYLYLPKNVERPLETVIYWPGSSARRRSSIDQEPLNYFSFLIKNGWALAQPIFTGSYGENVGDIDSSIVQSENFVETTHYRDIHIRWVQELSRAIDYLETREELKTHNLGFYGLSWGAELAPTALAVEERIKVAVINSGGLKIRKIIPEVDPFNFISQVDCPTLMLNGQFDIFYPYETSQKPMFEMLGTDPQHKKFVSVPAAHFIPRNVAIRESIAWFEKYFAKEIIETTISEKSVAVLPFENRSKGDEDLFFTDGVHDELLTLISKISDIKTISRSSVMFYRDSPRNLKAIGEELEVAHILEGGVQRVGDQVRINVQLIDADTDFQVWSDTYTREMTVEKLLAIQSEIAASIADELKAVISPDEQLRIQKLPTESWEALEIYFKGQEAGSRERGRAGLGNAIKLYEEALSLDPNFALAHAALGDGLLRMTAQAGLPLEQQIVKAEHHIQRALELDDTLPEAYFALADLKRFQRDSEASKAAIEAVLELDRNNARAYAGLANWHRGTLSDHEEASRLYLKAFALDPKSPNSQGHYIKSLIYSGNMEEALKLREAVVEENPGDLGALRELERLYRMIGRYDDAIVTVDKQLALDPSSMSAPTWMFNYYLNLGDVAKALEWTEYTGRTNPKDLYMSLVWKGTILGDENLRRQSALNHLSIYSQSLLTQLTLIELDLAEGKIVEAQKQLEKSYPRLFDPTVEILEERQWAAVLAVRICMLTGREEQAGKLTKQIQAREQSIVGRPFTENGPYEILAWTIFGDESQAKAALKRYLDKGGSPYRLKIEDDLKSFIKLPEFETIVAPRKAELAAQLKRIRDLESSGALPTLSKLLSE